MMEKWLSLLNHIQNVHVGHGHLFKRCLHDDLVGKERKKDWLKPGSKVYEKLADLLTPHQMKKDIPMLSSNEQTSGLEAFHSVMNHFAPKMIGFSYNGMMCRLALAALHFNENTKRAQAVTQEGNARYRIEFPKFKPGEYTVRKVYVKTTYEYVSTITSLVLKLATSDKLSESTDVVPKPPPPLCEKYVRPSKKEAVAGLKSRFSQK